MKSTETTLLMALDYEHLSELRIAWPTWIKSWPELLEMPAVCFCDGVQSKGWWERQLDLMLGRNPFKVVPWPRMKGIDHRERMLSAFVTGAAMQVLASAINTPWYLKIDTDCVCVERDERFCGDEWYDSNVMTAGRWGYTRPISKHHRLLEWAAGQSEFNGRPEVPGKEDETKDRVNHKRIISCLMLGQTEFLMQVARIIGFAPSIPGGSQDGLMWYVAHRLGLPYRRVNMAHVGWRHRRTKLERWHREIMGEEAVI